MFIHRHHPAASLHHLHGMVSHEPTSVSANYVVQGFGIIMGRSISRAVAVDDTDTGTASTSLPTRTQSKVSAITPCIKQMTGWTAEQHRHWSFRRRAWRLAGGGCARHAAINENRGDGADRERSKAAPQRSLEGLGGRHERLKRDETLVEGV
ncbi:hypothetical protein V8C26DRAFT_407071 [Trichoderma gracile]